MASRPQMLVWTMCDGVHIDPSSGKHYLMGIFSNIRGRSFPFVHPKMTWFLTLVDVSVGRHMLSISVGLNIEQATRIIHREFESISPLQRINLINEMHNYRFEEPGAYTITVEIDDEVLLVTDLLINP
jgi:hypothetical protein